MAIYFHDGKFYDNAIMSPPAGAVKITAAKYAQMLAGQSPSMRIVADEAGKPVLQAVTPTAEQITATLTAAVQSHLDEAARAAGYDDIKSAVTYAEEPAVPAFQAEGLAFRAWRSLVWAHCYAAMAAVQAGERAVPTAAELISELPALQLNDGGANV